MNNIYFILQIRTSSTRMKGKMLRPFYQEKLIPEVIITRLKDHGFSTKNIIIATTNNNADDELVERLNSTGCKIFRGDENNVLKRFIDAASFFKVEKIVRVCADNPFLNLNFLTNLLSTNIHDFDYISYFLNNNTPAIKTHFGFFAEFVQLEALKKAYLKTKEKYHLEHVTPFIYENPQYFKIKKLEIPKILKSNQWLRLTIDTINDFQIAKEIFTIASDPDNINELIDIAKKIGARSSMVQTIRENSK